MKQKRILVAFVVGALVISGGIARAVLIAPSTPRSAPLAAADPAHPALDLPTGQTGGGQNEAIAVHGAWTITVLSPDGELVSTTSFENSYNSSSFLADVLARQGGVGFWEVFVGGSNSPCLSSGSPTSCVITEPGGWESSPNAFKTLVVSAPHSGADANKLMLSGSATAQRDGSIERVNTNTQECDSSYAPNSPCTSFVMSADFTQKTIAPSIPVITGQQILVTVAISFS